MRLTQNFVLAEFATRDGTPVPPDRVELVRRLAKNLQVLRDFYARPITVTSGYRHAEYNRRVGSSDGSRHVVGDAADFRVAGVDPGDVAETVEGLIRCGAMEPGGLGIYRGHVHYDLGGPRRRWDQR